MAPPVARTTARMNGKWQTAQSDVPAPTFGDYGKQAVNSLAFQADFLSSRAVRGTWRSRTRRSVLAAMIVRGLRDFLPPGISPRGWGTAWRRILFPPCGDARLVPSALRLAAPHRGSRHPSLPAR